MSFQSIGQDNARDMRTPTTLVLSERASHARKKQQRPTHDSKHMVASSSLTSPRAMKSDSPYPGSPFQRLPRCSSSATDSACLRPLVLLFKPDSCFGAVG